jgi:hypothetical protein
MTPRRAALVGLVFVAIALFYLGFQLAGAEPGYVIDLSGVTMLVALGVAMSVMAYVLVDGMQQR